MMCDRAVRLLMVGVFLIASACACRPTDHGSLATASASSSAGTLLNPTGAAPASASTAPRPVAAKAPCRVSGAFDLTRFASDPACTLEEGDPQEAAAMRGDRKDTPLDLEATPKNIHVKAGGHIEVELTITNHTLHDVDCVLLVQPDEWFSIATQQSGTDGGEKMQLISERSPGFAASPTAWWASFRFAPGAAGKTTIVAKASAHRMEHLQASGNSPSPWLETTVPMVPGSYSLLFSSRTANPFLDNPGRGTPVVLVVDR